MAKNQTETTLYIEEMLTELRALSDAANTKELSYFLEMAILKARECSKSNKAKTSKKATRKTKKLTAIKA